MIKITALLLSCILATALFSGCRRGDGPLPVSVNNSADILMAGGSSFIYPAMNRWAYDYYAKTGVQINYQSLGSSGGIKQFIMKTLAFGATDAPMNTEQTAAVDGNVYHIPVIMGAVAITYNLPNLKKPLVFSGNVVADIYLGRITRWNDPAIAALNPGVTFPDKAIVGVRRADGSGTTYVFAEYLAKVSPEWKKVVGVGNSLSWPGHTIGAKGNEGVSAQVKRSPNSFGYVELVYALETGLPVAAIINSAGKPVIPSVTSVTAAAADLTTVPEDLKMTITDGPGEESYPIAGLAWIVARKSMESKEQAKALRKFLAYILSDDAQQVAAKMNYSPLPQKLLEPARIKAKQISGIH